MRQVIKHKDIRLLNMIRRTDPVIPTAFIQRKAEKSYKVTKKREQNKKNSFFFYAE